MSNVECTKCICTHRSSFDDDDHINKMHTYLTRVILRTKAIVYFSASTTFWKIMGRIAPRTVMVMEGKYWTSSNSSTFPVPVTPVCSLTYWTHPTQKEQMSAKTSLTYWTHPAQKEQMNAKTSLTHWTHPTQKGQMSANTSLTNWFHTIDKEQTSTNKLLLYGECKEHLIKK